MGWITSLRNSLSVAIDAYLDATGNGFDPEGCLLPSFPNQAPPSVKVPQEKKEKQKGGNWVGFDGSKMFSADDNTVELEDPKEYGITDREYGEMLSGNPPIRNLDLAKRIKGLKNRGKTLAEIASITGESLSLIKHYSAAFYRASQF